MESLGTGDLAALLAGVTEIYRVRDREAYPARALSVVRDLIPGVSHLYTEARLQGSTGLLEPSGMPFHQVVQAFERHLDEHPLVQHFQRSGDTGARTFSDFLSQRQLGALGLHADLLRPLDVGDQLAISLQAAGAVPVGIGVNRERPTFTDRDRLIMDLLRPHLVQAYQNATVMTRLGETMDAKRQAIVVVDRQGQVAFATQAACRLLTSYGESAPLTGGGDLLPEPFRRWLRSHLAALADDDAPAPLSPLVLTGEDRRLIVRLSADPDSDGQHTLVLEERLTLSDAVLRPLGLSRREREVAQLLARGLTAGQMGEQLAISVRTVEKHLEHIYAKLGVGGSGAARARLGKLLRSTA
jgi:DNA-binding CsgD family transcriptional regulator